MTHPAHANTLVDLTTVLTHVVGQRAGHHHRVHLGLSVEPDTGLHRERQFGAVGGLDR